MNQQIIQVALEQYGLKETPGSADNAQILAMAKDCGFDDYVHDSIAWCSLFANWVCLKANYPRSNSLMARSWLNVGVPVNAIQQADIVVFWRGDPKGTEGHVGFPIAQRDGLIYVLGGNEGDMVQIEGFDPSKILGLRSLSPVAVIGGIK